MKKSLLMIALRCCVAIFFAASSGCTIPRNLWSQADTHYTAVKIKDWENPVPREDSTIRVLLVHGMNNFPFGGSLDNPNYLGYHSYAELADHMATWTENSPEWTPMVKAAVQQDWDQFITTASVKLHHKECSLPGCEFHLWKDPASGRVVGYTYARTFGPNENGVKLKCYVANWGLGAAVLKERTFQNLAKPTLFGVATKEYSPSDESDFDAKLNASRAWLNKKIKLNVMDWGLGDAALYLGDEKTKFTIPVEHALKQLLRESSPNDHIAIVTHSLGSTITFDAVTARLHEEAASVRRGQGTIKSILVSSEAATQPGKRPRNRLPASNVTFYMLANQYVLLKMGNNNALAKLNAALPAGQLKARGIFVQIYAFTDPQDLLSYPLNLHSDVISTCNVYVRNPGVNLGLFIEPLEAHVNYTENSAVLRSMLNSPPNVIVK